jgi:hypothetical protein
LPLQDGWPPAHTRGSITEGVQKRSRRKSNPKSPTLTNRGWGTETLKPVLVEGADLVVQEREFGLVVVLGAGLLDLGLSLIQLGLA